VLWSYTSNSPCVFLPWCLVKVQDTSLWRGSYMSSETTLSLLLRFTKYYSCDQIKEVEMGGTCNTHGEIRNAYNILAEKLKRRDYLGDMSVDMRIILT
jgi:hypothetical protein